LEPVEAATNKHAALPRNCQATTVAFLNTMIFRKSDLNKRPHMSFQLFKGLRGSMKGKLMHVLYMHQVDNTGVSHVAVAFLQREEECAIDFRCTSVCAHQNIQ
jgi:hypothetical protein